MNYEEWEILVPVEITNDSLWKMEAYRLALFAVDVGWHDATKLMQNKRTLGLSDQLYQALGSVSANLAESYSRGTGRDRVRFYEYALGSASVRESGLVLSGTTHIGSGSHRTSSEPSYSNYSPATDDSPTTTTGDST